MKKAIRVILNLNLKKMVKHLFSELTYSGKKFLQIPQYLKKLQKNSFFTNNLKQLQCLIQHPFY